MIREADGVCYVHVPTWDMVLSLVGQGEKAGLYYWPPLNYRPVAVNVPFVGVRANAIGRNILFGRTMEGDPFTADEGHLDRFYVRAELLPGPTRAPFGACLLGIWGVGG